ncbi:MAG: aminopeptidase P family protein [Oxalobacter sp.]|nr:MAG: aminopeptidase P family protein [Oxalobacter sp.]
MPPPSVSRIQGLRQAMQRHHIDACVILSADPHLSEYLPPPWQSREWLSGFTGSAGTLVVTARFAGLWTDSRYWEQAETQLAGSGIELMKLAGANQTPYITWLAENLRAGQTVAVDGMVLSWSLARQMTDAFTPSLILLRTDIDLLADIWADRPALPTTPVYEHPMPFADVSRAAKLAATRHAMRQHNTDWHFLSTLDDIAWLFNLRGSDLNYSPYFIAHALIGHERATLFVTAGKVPPDLQRTLANDGVELAAYDQAAAALAALPPDAPLLLDPRRVTLGLRQCIPSAEKIVDAINPTIFSKSRKTDGQIAHVRATMEQDGAALCEFFAWLESALSNPAETIAELTIDERITAARAKRPHFVSPSFGTIAGFNANGALPHYHATKGRHTAITGNGLLLIDSGGQYFGGTTDITRTIAIGDVSAEQKRDFTLVLKGAIALLAAQFPRGVRAPLLDSLARAPLWAEGLDYGHGTGHGVGYFLGVHEGPQSISFHTPPEPHTALEPGMITSVEPALYRPGQWGVRIENLALTQETDEGDYLRFETLTLCPIDTRCIDVALLEPRERAWLNDYHATVRARLLPHVEGEAKAWLVKHTTAQ